MMTALASPTPSAATAKIKKCPPAGEPHGHTPGHARPGQPAFRHGPQPEHKPPRYVDCPDYLAHRRGDDVRLVWRRWADMLNDRRRRRAHVVTNLACRECGRVIGAVAAIDGALVAGALSDGVYDRFQLLHLDGPTDVPTQALRAASQPIETIDCPSGHQRSLKAFLALSVSEVHAKRTRKI